HVLSDAETLCSRVAILAKGRLVTAGRLNEMLAFRARGWELVASGITQPVLGSISPRATRVTKIGEDRFSFELPLGQPVERVLSELTAGRGALASLNPHHGKPEDLLGQPVKAPETDPHDRGFYSPEIAGRHQW